MAGFYDPQPVPGVRAQTALLEQERRDRFRRQCGDRLASAAVYRGHRRDGGGLRGDGPRGPGGGRAQPRAGVEVWNPFVLQPMDIGPIVESVPKTGRLLVVQECGATQGLGDRMISLIVRAGAGGAEMRRRGWLPRRTCPCPSPPSWRPTTGPTAAKIRRPSSRWSGRSDGQHSCSRCRCTCRPKGPRRPRPRSSSGTWPRATASRKGQVAGPDRQREVGLRFQAPCAGCVIRRSAPGRRNRCRSPSRSWRSKPTIRRCAIGFRRRPPRERPRPRPADRGSRGRLRAAGGERSSSGLWRLPARTRGDQRGIGAELPEISAEYVYQVTGIRAAALGRGQGRKAFGHGLRGGAWRRFASRTSPPRTSTR